MGKGKWGSSALAISNDSFTWILILHPQDLVLIVWKQYSYNILTFLFEFEFDYYS